MTRRPNLTVSACERDHDERADGQTRPRPGGPALLAAVEEGKHDDDERGGEQGGAEDGKHVGRQDRGGRALGEARRDKEARARGERAQRRGDGERRQPRAERAAAVSVLRLIPGLRWLLWVLLFKRVVAAVPWRGALDASIRQQKRRKLPEAPDKAEVKKLLRREAGLSAVTEEAVVLPTRVRDDLHQRIVTMSSGCIGISGLRGAGKSTLIQDFCAHRYGTPSQPESDLKPDKHLLPGLRIMVQAPLEFDAREFLIHQYTCLCWAVVEDVRFNPTKLSSQLLFLFAPNRIRAGALFRVLSGLVLFAASAVLSYRVVAGRWPDPFGGPVRLGDRRCGGRTGRRDNCRRLAERARDPRDPPCRQPCL